MGASDPLVFSGAVMAAAEAACRHRAPLLLRWGQLEGPEGQALREQLDRAAALVPRKLRARVLGPIRLPAKKDEQVRTAIGVLLLAKTLHDLGWAVEFEPEIKGGTPDLRITKADDSLVVEVRRVGRYGRGYNLPAIDRIRSELDGMQTHTPISLAGVHLPGDASLKPFVRWLKCLLSSSPPPGRYRFSEDRVGIAFDVRRAFDAPVPVMVGWQGQIRLGTDVEEVRRHLNAKLKAYKVPLVVALDFFDPITPFQDVEDVLLGRRTWNVPVALEPGVDVDSEVTEGRALDGLLMGAGRESERARERLVAALPFFCRPTLDGGAFAVHARLIANPAAGAAAPLAMSGFAPMPRLVVVEETADARVMSYLDVDDEPWSERPIWSHVP